MTIIIYKLCQRIDHINVLSTQYVVVAKVEDISHGLRHVLIRHAPSGSRDEAPVRQIIQCRARSALVCPILPVIMVGLVVVLLRIKFQGFLHGNDVIRSRSVQLVMAMIGCPKWESRSRILQRRPAGD